MLISHKKVLCGVIYFLLFQSIWATPLSSVLYAAGEGHITSEKYYDERKALLDVSTDGGKTWTFASSVFKEFAGYYGLRKNASDCVGNGADAVCVVAGLQSKNNNRAGVINFMPDLLVSTDGGQSWSNKYITGLPPYDELEMLRGNVCTGGNGVAVNCMVLGSYRVVDGANADFIAFSHDGAKTWQIQQASGFLPADKWIRYSVGTCTGSGDNTFCAVAGSSRLDDHFIVTTENAGKSWHKVSDLMGFNYGMQLSTLSCTGQGEKVVCAGVGRDHVLVSQGGKSWINRGIPLPDKKIATLYDVSCTGEGSSAICAAVGASQYNSGQIEDPEVRPYLITSQNGGSTWQIQSLDALYDVAGLSSVSCTGEGDHAICVAGGTMSNGNYNGYAIPLLYVSIDGGRSWSRKATPAFPAASINKIECKGDEANMFCTLQGEERRTSTIAGFNSAPLLAVSTDKGNTWIKPEVKGMPVFTRASLGNQA